MVFISTTAIETLRHQYRNMNRDYTTVYKHVYMHMFIFRLLHTILQSICFSSVSQSKPSLSELRTVEHTLLRGIK